jgi:hypothetical protein
MKEEMEIQAYLLISGRGGSEKENQGFFTGEMLFFQRQCANR